MRAVLVAVAAVLGIVGLAGCGGDDTGTDWADVVTTETVTETVAPLEADPVSPDDMTDVEESFVVAYHTNVVDPESTPDQIIELGYTVCQGFNSGMTFEDEVTLLEAAGYGVGEPGTIIGAAIASFCPGNASAIPGY